MSHADYVLYPFDGSLQISHVAGMDGDDGIRLTLQDIASGIRCVDIILSLAEFSKALMQMPGACVYALRGVEHVGKPLEQHQTQVPSDPQNP